MLEKPLWWGGLRIVKAVTGRRPGTAAARSQLSLNICTPVSLLRWTPWFSAGHRTAWIQGIFPGSLEIWCGIATKF